MQHVLDRHATDDRAEVTGEQFMDGGPHAVGILLQEPACRIGDRGQVVADLVRDSTLDLQGNRLDGHRVDDQAGGPDVQPEAADGLEARDDRASLGSATRQTSRNNKIRNDGDDRDGHGGSSNLGW